MDEYLSLAPEHARPMLKIMRRTIKKASPKAEERISYGMPAFKYHGFLVAFAAFSRHCTLFVSKAVNTRYKKDLKPFDWAGATIRFTVDKPLPASLVKKLVRARMKQNELRISTKPYHPMRIP